MVGCVNSPPEVRGNQDAGSRSLSSVFYLPSVYGEQSTVELRPWEGMAVLQLKKDAHCIKRACLP